MIAFLKGSTQAMARSNAKGSAHRGGTFQSFLVQAWFAFDRGIERVCNVMLALSAFCLFVMMAVMTAYIVTRKLGVPLPGAFYLSQELMVLVFAFPLGAATLRGAHIVFELVDKSFSSAVKMWLQFIGNCVGLIFFVALSWKAINLGIAAAETGEFQQGVVNVPIWPFRLVLGGALVVFSLALLVGGIRRLRAARGLPPCNTASQPEVE